MGGVMSAMPGSVDRFLKSGRLVVAGVSRSGKQPANGIFRRLAANGYDVVPVNPGADQVEGVTCYHDVREIPGEVGGVMVATHPSVAADVVRGCAERGVKHVWLHRSVGQGSYSDDAVAECRRAGMECIAGGCPLMFCEPVDPFHRLMRWWFQRTGRVPR
jgi:predicted CoA-binding protein